MSVTVTVSKDNPITISIDASSALKGLDAYAKEVKKAVRAALIIEAEKVATQSRTILQEHNYTGALARSIRVDAMPDKFNRPDTFLVAIVAGGEARGNTSYAAAVHEGSKPHWPPIWSRKESRALPPLAKWAKYKFGLSDKEARSVGLLIAAKISHKGTPALKYIERPLLASLKDIRNGIEAAVKAVRYKLMSGVAPDAGKK